MEKFTVHILAKDEAQELLQNASGDSGLKLVELVKDPAGFYTAASDSTFLDAGQVDQKLAEALGIGKSVHYALGDGSIIVIPAAQSRRFLDLWLSAG